MMSAWVTAQVEDLEEAIMDPDSPVERMVDYREALNHLRWLKNNWI